MLESGIDDALARVDEIVNIVERVEIADGRDSVFFEEIGVQLDNIARLRFEADDIDPCLLYTSPSPRDS